MSDISETCGVLSQIDDHPPCILDPRHVVRRQWHQDARGTQWSLGPMTEVPEFEPGHGRPDLDMLHRVVQMIDRGDVDEVRETVAQYLVARAEDPRPMHEERQWSPGDKCQLIGDYKVRHIEPCADGHKTGVVTDVRTGKIVERP